MRFSALRAIGSSTGAFFTYFFTNRRCVVGAGEEIKQIADYISIYPGGKGCVRDVIEQTLRLHGNWFHPDAVVW